MYGVYDICQNKGFINIGRSADTSEFACNSIEFWWDEYGCKDYPNAVSILILADSGGSNSSRHHIFKYDLENMAENISMEVRMAHFPPYTSKWNPIEHRLFPHITRSLSGIMLKSYEMVKNLIDKTTTKTGLSVVSNICKKIYNTGRSVTEGFLDSCEIEKDVIFPKWNYVANPLESVSN